MSLYRYTHEKGVKWGGVAWRLILVVVCTFERLQGVVGLRNVSNVRAHVCDACR